MTINIPTTPPAAPLAERLDDLALVYTIGIFDSEDPEELLRQAASELRAQAAEIARLAERVQELEALNADVVTNGVDDVAGDALDDRDETIDRLERQLAGAREALRELRGLFDKDGALFCSGDHQLEVIAKVDAALAGEAPDADAGDLGARALTVLADCLPLIEASEDAQLVGHEGCLWPAESARALIAEAREAGLLPVSTDAGLRAGEVGNV